MILLFPLPLWERVPEAGEGAFRAMPLPLILPSGTFSHKGRRNSLAQPRLANHSSSLPSLRSLSSGVEK